VSKPSVATFGGLDRLE